MNVSIQCVACGAIQENAYIVSREGQEACVVIDPGDEYPKLKRALGEKRVGAILLTHGHFDHIMAAGPMAAEFGAPVYIHAADIEMLDDAKLNGYESLTGMGRADWPPVGAVPYGGERVSACGLDFEVLSTPGHSKGSVCLYLEDAGALFSGDTLFQAGYGRMDLHGGDVNQMIESLKRLFALPGEVAVYPGHGGRTTIGAERARYRL